MSTANRVFKNTIFLYGKIAITSICLILSTRYVLQGLGIEDFGVYNLICSTIVMLNFLNDSMTAATQRFMSYAEGAGEKEKSVKIFNSSYIVHIGIALLIAFTFLLLTPVVFGSYLQIPSERIQAAILVYFFMILTTAMNMMTVPYNAVLIAHENLLYFALIGIFDGVLKLAAAIGIIYVSSDKLIMYGLFLLIVGILNFIIIRIYCHSKYSECSIHLRRYSDKGIIKEMFSFAGWQMTYSASSILSIQGMSLLLNSFYGTLMNAAQGIARQVCGQMMTLTTTMMSALNPVIIKKAGAKDTDSMVRTVMIGSKLSYILVILIAMPLLFELPYLLDIWLSEVPDYAIQFSRWEIIQQIIASFTLALVTMISGVGDIKQFQLFSSLTYIVRLPMIYFVLCLGFVPVSAYYISTVAVILLCAGRVYFAHAKCNLPVLRYIKAVILPCLIVTLIMTMSIGIVVSLMQISWQRLLITFGVSTTTLLVGAYLLVLNDEERNMLKNYLYPIIMRFTGKTMGRL